MQGRRQEAHPSHMEVAPGGCGGSLSQALGGHQGGQGSARGLREALERDECVLAQTPILSCQCMDGNFQ